MKEEPKLYHMSATPAGKLTINKEDQCTISSAMGAFLFTTIVT
jgi:hypothetical protein